MYDEGIIWRFLIALVVTLIIEISMLLIIAKKWCKKAFSGIKTSQIVGAGFLASSTLLPYLWFVFPFFFEDRLVLAAVGETIVVLGETLIYILVLKLNLKTAILASVCCNAVSWSLGETFNFYLYR